MGLWEGEVKRWGILAFAGENSCLTLLQGVQPHFGLSPQPGFLPALSWGRCNVAAG